MEFLPVSLPGEDIVRHHTVQTTHNPDRDQQPAAVILITCILYNSIAYLVLSLELTELSFLLFDILALTMSSLSELLISRCSRLVLRSLVVDVCHVDHLDVVQGP